MVRAVDPELNRDAYGAEVYVQAGERRWMRWINPGYSYLCSNDVRAHFGLGDVTKIDTIRVVWPDGETHVIRVAGMSQCDTTGRVLSIVGVNWDITEQKRAETDLIEYAATQAVLLR